MAELDDQRLDYYAAPGPMTDLTGVPAEVFDGLPTDPVGLCRTVQGLIVHEMWANARVRRARGSADWTCRHGRRSR